MTTRRSIARLWPILLLPACSGIDGGVPDADALPRLTAREEVRIGHSNDPDIGFSRILGVDVDRVGNLYVFESLAREVRVFDRDGNRIRTWGGSGAGPGEFRMPEGFGVVGDTVYVEDMLNARITLFDLRGEILEDIRRVYMNLETGNPGVSVRTAPSDLRADGLFEGSRGFSFSPDLVTEAPVVAPRVLFDRTGAIVDTISLDTLLPSRFRRNVISETVEVGGVRMFPPELPSDQPYDWTSEQGRLRIERPHATSAEDAFFTVTRWTEDGDPLFHHRFRYAPLPYDDAARERVVEARVENYYGRDGADIDAIRRWLREVIELPPYHNPVANVDAGEDGALWIEREDDGSDFRRWIVIAPDGGIRGQVELPRNAELRWASGDEVWVIEPDSMDVPWLVRYRVG